VNVGDVVVARYDAPMYIGTKQVESLRAGDSFKVAAVKGRWVGVAGKGWVRRRHLIRRRN
jgi:hypothetical protein